jgi:hypothetical protein
VLAWTFWLGISKKDWPPSPCRRMLAPSVPSAEVAAAPGTPEVVRNWSAGAEILKRIGRPLLEMRLVQSLVTFVEVVDVLYHDSIVHDDRSILSLGQALWDLCSLLLRRGLLLCSAIATSSASISVSLREGGG